VTQHLKCVQKVGGGGILSGVVVRIAVFRECEREWACLECKNDSENKWFDCFKNYTTKVRPLLAGASFSSTVQFEHFPIRFRFWKRLCGSNAF